MLIVRRKANLYGMGTDILIDSQAKFPVFIGATILKRVQQR